jgi:C1A family cysteine protease
MGQPKYLEKAVNVNPVSVAVDASNWKFYEGGIFNNCRSEPEHMNHGVLLVGYDEESYIIKNSWGTRWGEDGYIRLAKKGNVCGIANSASFPIA